MLTAADSSDLASYLRRQGVILENGTIHFSSLGNISVHAAKALLMAIMHACAEGAAAPGADAESIWQAFSAHVQAMRAAAGIFVVQEFLWERCEGAEVYRFHKTIKCLLRDVDATVLPEDRAELFRFMREEWLPRHKCGADMVLKPFR